MEGYIMAGYKSIKEVMNEIDSKSADVQNLWTVSVCLGKSAKYDHPVFLLYIKSKLIKDASIFVMQEDFNLHYSKKVKPFLGKTGVVYSYTEGKFKEEIEALFRDGMIVEDCDIDGLIGSVVTDEWVGKYYSNLCNYVKNNAEQFGERKDKSDSEEENETSNDYNPRLHLGAFLRDAMYMGKYRCSDNGAALALKIDQFKILCEIDLNRFQVKDVVQAFISRGYILTGDSKTVEKDITLSRGNQERCYVIDLSK